MKIEAVSVPAPSQMEPVATKGHDDESQASGDFLAEINKLTTPTDEPPAKNQRGNLRTKATATLRDDPTHEGTGESALSEIQSEDSSGTCAVPVAASMALEDADIAALELEEPIEFLAGDNGNINDPDAPQVTEMAGESAVSGLPVNCEQNGSVPATPGFSTVPPLVAKPHLTPPQNTLPGADIIAGATHLPPLIESSQNVLVETPAGATQPPTPSELAAGGVPPGRQSPEFNAPSLESSVAAPRALKYGTSIPAECVSPAVSYGLANGVSEPLGEASHVAAPEACKSTPEVTAAISDPPTGGFWVSGSSETTVSAAPRTVSQTRDAPDPGVGTSQPSVFSNPAAAPRLPHGVSAGTAESPRVGGPTALSRDAVLASKAVRVEATNLSSAAASPAPDSDTPQAGNRPEPVETAASKAGKETTKSPEGADGSRNTPGTASETLPDRAFVAQVMTARDSARNIAEAGMPQKPMSIKEHAPIQYVAPGSIQTGETSAGAPSRPVSVPPSRVPEFITQLADRLQLQIQRGENQIRIQLRPESLGMLEISALNGIDGIVGRITTESARVREYLENNLPILQQNLQDQGLKVDRIEVVLQDAFDTRQPNAQHQPLNHSGREHNGESSRRSSGATRVQSRTSSDGFAIDPLTRLTLGPDSTFHTIA